MTGRGRVVYLLHLSRPLAHARHYLGSTDDLEGRLRLHAAGGGARLLEVAAERGITWQLVRTWDGDRAQERRLKHATGTVLRSARSAGLLRAGRSPVLPALAGLRAATVSGSGGSAPGGRARPDGAPIGVRDASAGARSVGRCAVRGGGAPATVGPCGGAVAGNLNRALLIGVVARPAELDGAGWRLTVAIPTEGEAGLHVERVVVTGDTRLSAVVRELQSAQLVYVEGRLARGEDRRAVVRAGSVMALADPPPPPEPSGPGGGTHASPRAHERAGHARVLHRGTDRERVVWVRSTSVGGPPARRSMPVAATLPGDAGSATPG